MDIENKPAVVIPGAKIYKFTNEQVEEALRLYLRTKGYNISESEQILI